MAKTMLIRTVPMPGEPGTQKLTQHYGDRLVCLCSSCALSLGKRTLNSTKYYISETILGTTVPS